MSDVSISPVMQASEVAKARLEQAESSIASKKATMDKLDLGTKHLKLFLQFILSNISDCCSFRSSQHWNLPIFEFSISESGDVALNSTSFVKLSVKSFSPSTTFWNSWLVCMFKRSTCVSRKTAPSGSKTKDCLVK